MIEFDVKLSLNGINDQAQELIREEVRRSMLPFIFKAVDDVAARNGFSFDHKNVDVEGNIKTTRA